MTEIDADNEGITLVNVFTVEPQHQNRLVELLIDATEETMGDIPGYVSANIHRSLDGEQVVNYAQWESREAFEAMLDDSEAGEHITEIADLADFDFNLYEVAYTDEAEP